LSSDKVAVVTGSSRGIGLHIALTLAKNGYITYATMRDLSKKSELESIAKEKRLISF
jgi:NAD(P)-dependent dehydrogenase (short-subunit alcohol dehydrogenase family)